jgi:hypothetical protein
MICLFRFYSRRSGKVLEFVGTMAYAREILGNRSYGWYLLGDGPNDTTPPFYCD